MDKKILATVSGVEITESDLNEVIERYPAEQRMYFQNEQGKKQVLEQMISFELMNKLGNELKINETEEFKNALEKVSKDLLTQMTINKVLSEVTVTDDEVKKYYDDNKDQFKDKETVTAKHILVDSKEKCIEIKEEIANNQCTFEEAAEKYSTCPSKENGGSLGAFSRGMMVPEFEKVAFESEVGKVSEPVETQFGCHLILVEERSESNAKSFDEVKDSIKSMVLQQQQQKKYVDLVAELEGKYKVTREA